MSAVQICAAEVGLSVLLHPLSGSSVSRARRPGTVPSPQPQELGTAGLPAPLEGPPAAASSPGCCSARPTTRCGRCGGASRSSGAGSATTRRSTEIRRPAAPGERRRPRRAEPGLGRRRRGRRPRRRAARRASGPGRAGLRVLAAAERRRLAAAAEAVLHEAALGLMAQGALDRPAASPCGRAMSPLDENHQALLIRLYRLMGDDGRRSSSTPPGGSARRELGVAPGVAIEAAMRERPRERVADDNQRRRSTPPSRSGRPRSRPAPRARGRIRCAAPPARRRQPAGHASGRSRRSWPRR